MTLAVFERVDEGDQVLQTLFGGQIDNTQPAVVLEKLINRLFAAFASRVSDKSSEEGAK